jgi:DNA-binding beta-propeller fold protein YncE
MRIGSGANTYEWIDNWARIPHNQSARMGWAHHGIAVTEAGDVVTFHHGDPTVLVFDQDGNLQRSWDSQMTEAHGITVVKEGQAEYLWFADSGRKRDPTLGYVYPVGNVPVSGQVVKTTLEGQTVMTLQRPDLPVYRQGNYMPTSVAVNEERHGGSGGIWVADGYGQSYVHRYDKSGNYLGSINGEEGQAGRFNTPHAIFIDRRKLEPELYIADRSNHRIQVYDLEGNFRRTFGVDFLSSPSGFVTQAAFLIIAELRARLAITDMDDNLVCYLGANESVCDVDGWPNNKNENGEIVPTKLLQTGKFNSPHGLAVDSQGNLYVAEFLIGGRFTKLAKC